MKRVLILLSVTALVGAIAMACGGGSATDTTATTGTTGTTSGGTDTTTAPAMDSDAGAPAASGGGM